jgi:hypothetical protein
MLHVTRKYIFGELYMSCSSQEILRPFLLAEGVGFKQWLVLSLNDNRMASNAFFPVLREMFVSTALWD